MLLLFFFKQKTAYEMRISDWSSDVCSSDLMIAISRTTGKVTKLLWDVGGQNGADLLWVPTDGSNHILVAAQNSIYVGEDFWPSVYRVDVTNGRKRVVLRGRSGVMDWGVDH